MVAQELFKWLSFTKTHRTKKYIHFIHRNGVLMGHTDFLKVKQSLHRSISIKWLTLGKQIFPCLVIAICLSSSSYSFHSLFQTYVATYLPGKEYLTFPLDVWWNGRRNGARESTINSYSHFCFLLTSFSLKFIPHVLRGMCNHRNIRDSCFRIWTRSNSLQKQMVPSSSELHASFIKRLSLQHRAWSNIGEGVLCLTLTNYQHNFLV